MCHLLNFIFTVYENWKVESKNFSYLLPLILETTVISHFTGDYPSVIPIFYSFTDWLTLILKEWFQCNF